MKFAFVFPKGTPQQAVEFAVAAEKAGWDGFFVWEPVYGIDPWVLLGAIAVNTERVRIGTLITPVSRRRPWKLAGELLTVDHLSNGRVILGVGLGAPETGFEAFGEEIDRKMRAELLDEGLEIMQGLWQGQPFNYEGKHYQVSELPRLIPTDPIQQPTIPIWAVGAWKWEKSLARALRYEGVIPMGLSPEKEYFSVSAEDIANLATYIATHRTAATPFDIIVEGTTDPATATEKVKPYADAGATWWIESMWSEPDLNKIRQRIDQGPPTLP